GPNNERNTLSEARRVDTAAERELLHRRDVERHVYRRGHAVLVLDLCFGQRRAAIETPVHGLSPAVQVTVVDDLAERSNLLRLIARIHRQIGIVPITEHAQSLEISALRCHLRRSKGSAGGTKAGGVQFLAGLTVLLLDRELDRQAMAIPSGNVG